MKSTYNLYKQNLNNPHLEESLLIDSAGEVIKECGLELEVSSPGLPIAGQIVDATTKWLLFRKVRSNPITEHYQKLCGK